MTVPYDDGAEAVAQARGEARLAPHLPAILSSLAALTEKLCVNTGELVLVLPESEWADVEPEERAVMVLGCRVVHADVPTPMIAVKVRRNASIAAAGPTP